MKKKGKIPGRYHKTLKEQVRENPRLAAVYVILRVLVVLALVAQVFNGNFENVFLCVLTLILFTIPSFIERTIRIDIPDTLEIIILLFIFAAEILGEIQAGEIMTGLSLALKATALGLAVAIPTLIVYNGLQRKINVLSTQWKEAHGK